MKDEEHRYATTFQVAEKVFHDEAKARRTDCCPAPAAFKLYDTYGLALEEQEEMARECGLAIDRDGFTARWRSSGRARAPVGRARKRRRSAPEFQALPRTEFVGRETLEAPATVVAAFDGEVVLDRTPFYAEAGGQVGDTGVLISTATGETVAVVERPTTALPARPFTK